MEINVDADALEQQQSQQAPAEPNPGADPAGDQPGERPAWLPEGFDSPEALVAEYAKLKETGSRPPADTTQAAPAEADKNVSKFVADAGLDPISLSREIASTGDINADAKAALKAKVEKAGLPAAMVDEYIAGQRYTAQAIVNDMFTVTGGREGFEAMAKWAGETLDQADLKAFSDIMEQGDPRTAKLTLKNLHARYRQEANLPGKQIKGSNGKPGGELFQSLEQLMAAQADPRYESDPAFREQVEDRLARSIKAKTLRIGMTR